MKEFTLYEHLTELRKTAIRIFLILVVGFFVCYGFGDVISEFLLAPLRSALVSSNGKIVQLGVLDKVLAQFQVAFWACLLLSSPLWFYELWKFIKPALYESEIKVIRPFVFVGFVLFCAGVCFGYFVVFPVTIQTLLDFGPGNVEATMSIKDYLLLCCKVLLFLGVVFQLPNIMLILGFMNLVTKYSLKELRRYIYVAFAIISSMLTPPDVVTMLGLWVPLILLYELGILAVALIVHPYLHRKNS